MGENGMASVDLGIQFFLIGAGIVTVLPILIYASCVKRLPDDDHGILQYLSPTLGIVCSYLRVRRWGKTNISVWLYLDRSASLQHRYAIREKKENRAALQEEGQHEENQ